MQNNIDWAQYLKPKKVNQVAVLLQQHKVSIQAHYNNGQSLNNIVQALNKAFQHTFVDQQIPVKPKKGQQKTYILGKPTIRLNQVQKLLGITPKKRSNNIN